MNFIHILLVRLLLITTALICRFLTAIQKGLTLILNVSADKFDYETALKLINENLNAAEIEELNVSENEIAVCALGAVILYLKDTQKKDEIEAPSEFEMYDTEKYMKLDMSARRNLELTKSMMTGDKRHSLLWVIDKTKTAAGKRMIRSWLERPLMSIAKITKRQNAVGELCDNPILRDEIRQALTGVSDIERLLYKNCLFNCQCKGT